MVFQMMMITMVFSDHIDPNYSAICKRNDNDDVDGDGILNSADIDNDNDGIIDNDEGGVNVDTDGDGIPNYLDIDSDGDGCFDAIEAGYTDADGDGEVDGTGYDPSTGMVVGSDGYGTPADEDNNGIADYVDENFFDACIGDADNDGVKIIQI